MTLVEFLLARIAEDEGVARAASIAEESERWNVITIDYEGIHVYGRPGGLDSEGGRKPVTAHMQRHDPARVLAECEAKRRIVGVYAPTWPRADDRYTIGWADAAGAVLEALALPYADHPDYREEWRP